MMWHSLEQSCKRHFLRFFYIQVKFVCYFCLAQTFCSHNSIVSTFLCLLSRLIKPFCLSESFEMVKISLWSSGHVGCYVAQTRLVLINILLGAPVHQSATLRGKVKDRSQSLHTKGIVVVQPLKLAFFFLLFPSENHHLTRMRKSKPKSCDSRFGQQHN